VFGDNPDEAADMRAWEDVPARQKLVETAYHEAGHAIASIDLGFRFTEAVIKKDGTGYVGPGVRLPRHWGHHFSPHGRERGEDQIVLFAAGPVAQAHLTGSRLYGLGQPETLRADWSQIKLRYDALEPGADLEWLVQRSRVLVARRWREIEFVATALVQQSRLSAADVVEHVVLAQVAHPPSASPMAEPS
jgi:hypothetical protein